MFTQWYKGGNAIVAAPTGLVMTIGASSTPGYGIVYGYTKDAHYLSAPDAGSVTYQYLRDIRDPANPKIVRIADIIIQQANYIVLCWEPITGTPDPSWPPFTWKLQVNGGSVYDFSTGSVPSVAAPCIGRYLTVGDTIPWRANTVGSTVNLSFI